MADMTNYEDVMVEETELDVEPGEGRDFSTLIGVGIIAGGTVVVYEGGKRVVKFAKNKVVPGIKKHLPFGKKDAEETAEPAPADQAESPSSDVEGEVK